MKEMEKQNKTNTHSQSKPHSFAAAELPDEKIKAIAETKMDNRHDHLNKLLHV